MCLPDACRASVLTKKVSPDILGLPELQLLLSKLAVRERTLALLDVATGLRVSELLHFAGAMLILRIWSFV